MRGIKGLGTRDWGLGKILNYELVSSLSLLLCALGLSSHLAGSACGRLGKTASYTLRVVWGGGFILHTSELSSP
jgi:hypothetical protein